MPPDRSDCKSVHSGLCPYRPDPPVHPCLWRIQGTGKRGRGGKKIAGRGKGSGSGGRVCGSYGMRAGGFGKADHGENIHPYHRHWGRRRLRRASAGISGYAGDVSGTKSDAEREHSYGIDIGKNKRDEGAGKRMETPGLYGGPGSHYGVSS